MSFHNLSGPNMASPDTRGYPRAAADNEIERGTSSVFDTHTDRAGLFVESTISQDDTQSEMWKKIQILSRMNNQQNESTSEDISQPGQAKATGLPPRTGPPLHAMPSFPLPRAGSPVSSASSSPNRRYMHRSRSLGGYPDRKITKDAAWRINLTKNGNGPAASGDEEARGRSLIRGDRPEQLGPERRPGLAETLSNVTREYLNIDVADQTSELPQFISYLFDTIERLENHVQLLRHYRDADDDTSSSSTVPEKESKGVVPRGQILHRVFCKSTWHDHDMAIYEDQPTFQKESIARLMGEVQVHNLVYYLERHPTISFVVFKEYNCTMKQRSRAIGRVYPEYNSSLRCERIQIVSPLLLEALKSIADFQFYNDNPLEFRPEVEPENMREMDAPYVFFFHHLAKMTALAREERYKGVLAPLLQFLNDNYSDEYQRANDMFDTGRTTAENIVYLFKPHQMVIRRSDNDFLRAGILDKYPLLKTDAIVLSGWAWNYNGNELGRVRWSGEIKLPEAENIVISDMYIHPAQFAEPEIIEQLKSRGEKFWDLKGQVYTCYTGWDADNNHHHVNARFMVDVATYNLMHNSASAHFPRNTVDSRFDTWPLKIDRKEDLPPDAGLLLPAIISGFSLDEKKWVRLNVENFHPVKWNKKAFERLVLEPKTKEMIHALVDVQTLSEKMDDIITGKGNGLIILLHGSPGTGKTLTAESVAEIAEKPLYRVTCGDIGTEASSVEKYLQTVLYLGKIWDCDEADVFLEERTMADLQRNSLVSVFLRILEYYEGILILTSNRVGTFDEAFKSRIQVAIHYEKLTKRARRSIWQNFLDMIDDSPDEDADMAELEGRLAELAAEEMNGRQIRNALLTARQLAKHRKERLGWDHLSQVMKTSAAFNKYLKAIKGHSDEQWAREEMLR